MREFIEKRERERDVRDQREKQRERCESLERKERDICKSLKKGDGYKDVRFKQGERNFG